MSIKVFLIYAAVVFLVIVLPGIPGLPFVSSIHFSMAFVLTTLWFIHEQLKFAVKMKGSDSRASAADSKMAIYPIIAIVLAIIVKIALIFFGKSALMFSSAYYLAIALWIIHLDRTPIAIIQNRTQGLSSQFDREG